MGELREGEIQLDFDPADSPPDGHFVFIGRIRSPWATLRDCPKNMGAARETQQPAYIELDPAYRAVLSKFFHRVELAVRAGPVSYTHLTLPTI